MAFEVQRIFQPSKGHDTAWANSKVSDGIKCDKNVCKEGDNEIPAPGWGRFDSGSGTGSFGDLHQRYSSIDVAPIWSTHPNMAIAVSFRGIKDAE